MSGTLTVKGHYWSWCGLCRRHMVMCGTCGNNCCNGGYGYLDKACKKQCPDCKECYAIQDNPSKLHLQILENYYCELVDGFYDTHTHRNTLLDAARKHHMVRPLKKLFKAIDDERSSIFGSASENDLSEWFNDETEKNKTKAQKRKEHLDYMGKQFHDAYRDKSAKYKMPMRISDGSKPKWENCSDEYKSFIISIMKRMRL